MCVKEKGVAVWQWKKIISYNAILCLTIYRIWSCVCVCAMYNIIYCVYYAIFNIIIVWKKIRIVSVLYYCVVFYYAIVIQYYYYSTINSINSSNTIVCVCVCSYLFMANIGYCGINVAAIIINIVSGHWLLILYVIYYYPWRTVPYLAWLTIIVCYSYWPDHYRNRTLSSIIGQWWLKSYYCPGNKYWP